MTDPVRPVAPREAEWQQLKTLNSALLGMIRRLQANLHFDPATRCYSVSEVAWFSQPYMGKTLAQWLDAEHLAAAPVPCAASPADPQEDVALETARDILDQSVCECGHTDCDHVGEGACHGDDRTCECRQFRDVEFTVARATGEGARDARGEQNGTATVELPALRETDRHLHAHGFGSDRDRAADERRESIPSLAADGADHNDAEQVAVSLDPHRLTFAEFSEANRQRCEDPRGFNHVLSSWSTSDWFVATVGELGEAANIVKKLNRYRDGVRGNKESEAALRAKLRGELADVFIYLDLIFQACGFDASEAIIDTFDAKSAEISYPARLRGEATVPPRNDLNGHLPDCRWSAAWRRYVCVNGCEIKRINDSAVIRHKIADLEADLVQLRKSAAVRVEE